MIIRRGLIFRIALDGEILREIDVGFWGEVRMFLVVVHVLPCLWAWARTVALPHGPTAEATTGLVRALLRAGCVVEEATPRGDRIYRSLEDLERWTPAGRWV